MTNVKDKINTCFLKNLILQLQIFSKANSVTAAQKRAREYARTLVRWKITHIIKGRKQIVVYVGVKIN